MWTVFVMYESLCDVLRLMFDLTLLQNTVYNTDLLEENKSFYRLYSSILFHILLSTLLKTSSTQFRFFCWLITGLNMDQSNPRLIYHNNVGLLVWISAQITFQSELISYNIADLLIRGMQFLQFHIFSLCFKAVVDKHIKTAQLYFVFIL